MRIGHNVIAMQVYGNTLKSNKKADKAMANLSSGLKVNSAKDDAAGLAIGNKLQNQIRGLERASRNSSDGISVVQTAEGALNEVHAMLQRMRELTLQAANGTNTPEDVEKMVGEADELCKEIVATADRTEFNNIKLLRGGVVQSATIVSATPNVTVTIPNTLELEPFTYTIDSVAAPAQAAFQLPADFAGSITLNGGPLIFIDRKNETNQEIIDKIAAQDPSLIVNINNDNDFTITTNNIGSTETIACTIATSPVSYKSDGSAAAAAEISFELPAVYKGTITVNVAPGTTYTTAPIDYPGTDSLSDILGLLNGIPGLTGDVSITPTAAGFTITNNTIGLGEDISCSLAYSSPGDAPAVPAVTIAAGADAAITLTQLTDKTGNTIPIASTDISYAGNTVTVTVGSETIELEINALLTGEGVYALADGTEIVKNGVTANGPIDCRVDYEYSRKPLALKLQIGPNQYMEMDIEINPLTLENLQLDDLKFSTPAETDETLIKLDHAIAEVSNIRAKLGAFQNRLEHTISSLDVANVNMQSARSRIMDTDMAQEMTLYSQQGVISQAGISILAQANQRPQQILGLIK